MASTPGVLRPSCATSASPTSLRRLRMTNLLHQSGRHPLHHLAELARAEAFGEAAHHLLHLQVLLQKLIDLLYRGAGAFGDALFAFAVDELRELALLFRHRVEDGLHADDRPLVDVLFADLAGAREHVHER